MTRKDDHLPDSLKSFFQTLKKIHLSNLASNSQENFISIKTVIQGLRFVEIDDFVKRHMKEALHLKAWPSRASAQEGVRLSEFQCKNVKLKLSPECRKFFNELAPILNSKNFIPDEIKPLSQTEFLKATFKKIRDGFAAKQPELAVDVVEKIARNLSKQIANGKHPATLFLHGSMYSGMDKLVQSLIEIFGAEGYKHKHIQCEQYLGEQDKCSWTGSNSVWQGSRTGEVTKFAYDYPKSIIVFNNISQSHRKVAESLNEAFEHGILTDQHGLEVIRNIEGFTYPPKSPTVVSMTDVIFIFTDTSASELYAQPALLAQIEANESIIIESLKTQTNNYKGREELSYSPSLLNHISPYLVPITPLPFKYQYEQYRKSLRSAFKQVAEHFGIEIEATQKTLNEVAKIILFNHELNKKPLLDVADKLINIQTILLSNQFKYRRLNLVVADKAKTQLAELQKELATHNHPQITFERQSRTVRVNTELVKDTLIFSSIEIKSINNVKEFNEEVKLQAEFPQGINLDSLIGHSHAKDFLQKTIRYLNAPSYIEENHISLPKGALFYGPPGSGKTHIARCFAGQAKLPLIVTTGPDLLRASYSKSLFKLVHKHSPCVVFIDEADALCNRATSETHAIAINKLLTEIQGFEKHGHVFYMLACNHPEKLDPALLRPGRIDRKFYIGSLDEASRLHMLRDIEKFCVINIDLYKLTQLTEGFTGAQIDQVIRECGLSFIDHNKPLCFQDVRQIVIGVEMGGVENIHIQTNPTQQKYAAIHEIGHALVQYELCADEKIKVISIQSNTNSIGYVQVGMCSQEITKTIIKNKLAVLLAGRVAESVMFGDDEVSVGSENDLKKATALAWKVITQEGFSSSLGLLALEVNDMPEALKMEYIKVLRVWLDEAYQKAKSIILQYQFCLSELADVLVQKVMIDGDDFSALVHQYANNHAKEIDFEKAA